MARRGQSQACGSLRLVAVLAVVIASAGCRAGGTGNLAARPDSLAPRPSMTAQAAIDRHNKNAELVRSLVAKPAISVTANGQHGGVNGRLALEMPRNFKLEMASTLSELANIGSNDEGFWFWVKTKKDPSIYVCAYEDLKATNLTATMQPEWIIEALGLRPISDREAATIATTPGDRPGTTWLTQRRKGEGGEVLTKQMLIDEKGQVREHRLYSGNKQTLLARAFIDEYRSVAVTPAPSAAGESSETPAVTVFVPYRFRLEWLQEKLALDITMDGMKVNTPFADSRREALFTEPTIPGTDRVNLAKIAPKSGQAQARANDRDTDVPPAYQRRTTRPAPPSGSGGIQLQEPEPLGAEGAMRTPREPVALSAAISENTPPAGRDRVVHPEIPRGTEP